MANEPAINDDDLLKQIKRHHAKWGYAPTFRVMAQYNDCSINSIHKAVRRLEDDGKLEIVQTMATVMRFPA